MARMVETEIPPLAGYTVGVTAARRAEELVTLLRRRGATVLSGAAIRIVPLPDDADARAATEAVIADPVDYVVVTTGIGFRGWTEAAGDWGLGPALHTVLGKADVIARGPKATGAVRASGLTEKWSPSSESNSEVLEHLLSSGVAGKRVAVQLHGEPLPHFVGSLRAAGADVVEVSVYRWTLPVDTGPLERLLDAVMAGEVDAVTFTSAPAATSFLAVAHEQGRGEALLNVLRERVLCVCVGPVTAGPLTAAGIPVAQPERSRLGALARTVVAELPARATRLRVGDSELELRGHAIVVDGVLRAVAPEPMAALRALAAEPGQVVSRETLTGLLGEHS